MVIDVATLYDFPRNIEKYFDMWGPSFISQRRMAYPPLNISEDEHNLYVRAEIPGLGIEDLDLTMTESSLVIKGERKVEQGKYFRQERPTGVFQRIVTINAPVDREKIKATMKDGLLQIVLPKAEEFKPKKISIAQG